MLVAYEPLDDYLLDSEPTIVIHTGLSVTVRGHVVDVYRDNAHKVATVRVGVIAGYTATGLEQADVAVAAELLAARAQRFLGRKWTVVRWQPPREAPAVGA